MTFRIRLELPGLTPMNTADGTHWRKRQRLKSQWEQEVWVALRKHGSTLPVGGPGLSRARVTITRRSSGPEPDYENLAQGGKFLLDALVKFGVLEDDSPRVIGRPEYCWERVARVDQAMVVEVEEMA